MYKKIILVNGGNILKYTESSRQKNINVWGGGGVQVKKITLYKLNNVVPWCAPVGIELRGRAEELLDLKGLHKS